jgi:hypothetical protein
LICDKIKGNSIFFCMKKEEEEMKERDRRFGRL